MKGIKRIGDIEAIEAIIAYNRSGSDRIIGDIVMLDLLQSATETTTITYGDESGVFANVVMPATAGLATFPMYVCLEDIADNDKGLMLACGPAAVMARDDDVATTNVDAGDGVSILNGLHDAEASATGNRILGIWLEDAEASGSPGDASLKRALWWGGRWGAGHVSA